MLTTLISPDRNSTQLLYALRVFRAHGLPQQSLNYVYRARVQAKIV